MVAEPLPTGSDWPVRDAVFAHPGRTALVALALGLAIDLLALRRPVGFGASLAMLIGVGVVMVADERSGARPGEFRWLMPVAVMNAVLVGWRASVAVAALNVLVYLIVMTVAVRLFEDVPLRTWTFGDYLWRGTSTVTGAVGESTRFLRHDVGRSALGRFKSLGPVLIGLLVAIPIAVVFLGLFASADAVFAEYVERVLSVDVEVARIISRLFTTSLLALAVLGVWRAVRSGFRPELTLPDRMPVSPVSATTTLVVTAALFAAFLVVQVTYLFGGRNVLDIVDITYAEYARRGFFEMVIAAFLVVVLVGIADAVASPAGRSRVLDLVSGALVLLTFGVVASAVVRMQLYTEAFGLTEQRVYASAFMVWTAIVLAWLPLTVLRGDRARFAFGMFISGLVVIVGLSLANPDGIIGSVNAGRAVSAGTTVAFDTEYVAGLSSDVVPALVSAVGRLDEPCQVVADLRAGRAAEDRSDWGWRSQTVSHLVAADRLANLPDC